MTCDELGPRLPPARAPGGGAALPMRPLTPGLRPLPLRDTTRGPKSLPAPTHVSDKDWEAAGGGAFLEQPLLLRAETRPGAGSIAGQDPPRGYIMTATAPASWVTLGKS